MKLAQLIQQSTIDSINNSVINSNDPEALGQAVSKDIKGIISYALTTYILPIAFFLILLFGIYGGILYFTAYGNEEKATRGKNTIIWSIVGAVVVAGAYAIVRYVGAITGADISGSLPY